MKRGTPTPLNMRARERVEAARRRVGFKDASRETNTSGRPSLSDGRAVRWSLLEGEFQGK
jgi:hypothetical protein